MFAIAWLGWQQYLHLKFRNVHQKYHHIMQIASSWNFQLQAQKGPELGEEHCRWKMFIHRFTFKRWHLLNNWCNIWVMQGWIISRRLDLRKRTMQSYLGGVILRNLGSSILIQNPRLPYTWTYHLFPIITYTYCRLIHTQHHSTIFFKIFLVPCKSFYVQINIRNRLFGKNGSTTFGCFQK